MDGTRHRGIHTGHGFYAYTYGTRHGCDGWIYGWNGCNGWIHGWIAHETSHSTCALIALGPGCAPRVENDFHVPREPGRAPYDEGTIIRSHPPALFASTLYMA